MANLADADRQAVWQQLMADFSRTRDELPLTKPDLRAAVDAIDAWVNSNAASLNAAIPQPARSALNATQKSRLMLATIQRRFDKGV